MRKWKQASTPEFHNRDPEAWLYLENMYPLSSGRYRSAPTFTAFGTAAAAPAAPGTVWNAVALQDTAGTNQTVYVGTSTKLFSATLANFLTGTFADRSKAGNYGGARKWWSFAQFGNFTIATNRFNPVQVRDITGAAVFADLAGAPPKALIAVVQSNAVVLFNIDDGTDKSNAWAASNVGDHTNWATVEAVTATPILHKSGPITAAIAFRDTIIVFKSDSVYQMRYVGTPRVWVVDSIADGIGAAGPGCVCSAGDAIYFGGAHGISSFDGASFRRLDEDNPVQASSNTAMQWFPAERSLLIEDNTGRIYVYNAVFKAWGLFTMFGTAGTTFGGSSETRMLLGDTQLVQTMLSGATVLRNGALALIDFSVNPCVLKSTNAWITTQRAALATSFIGADVGNTNWTRAIPIIGNAGATVLPPAAEMYLQPVTYGSPGEQFNAGIAVGTFNANGGQRRFNFRATNRWISVYFRLESATPIEVEDFLLIGTPAGTD